MPAMDFAKYHGLGNDYLVIDPASFPFVPTPAAVRVMCDPKRGVGSDGSLYGPLDPKDGLSLRIFNPDGSEAEKSGNGLRIFSWYLYEKGLAGTETFPLLTKGGRVEVTIVDSRSRLIRVDMGVPSFDARAVPVDAGLPEVVDQELDFGGTTCRITCVSMGNPHCVVLAPPGGVSEATARALGPLIESSPLFPKRTNVQFLEPAGPSEIRIEIWERGAGYTLASGSSSCAAAAAARRLGLVGDEVKVRMPGGDLDIRFEGGSALMTGPVAKVFEGRFSPELRELIAGAGGRP
jgi:diaminopimelate epimerase